jgi:hypothetical protein
MFPRTSAIAKTTMILGNIRTSIDDGGHDPKTPPSIGCLLQNLGKNYERARQFASPILPLSAHCCRISPEQFTASCLAVGSSRDPDTQITAPVDGTVGARSPRVEQYVQAGTQLMTMVPLGAVYVVANFKETQLTDVRDSQPVELRIDSFPGRRLPCR